MKNILVLSFLFMFFGNLMAQDGTISIPDLTEVTGTEILVPVNITPLNTVRRIGFRVKYNNSIMSIMKDENNNPIIENSSLSGVVAGTRGDSIITISWVSTTAANLDGKILDLKFQYHGGAGNIEFDYVGISENPGMGYDIAQDNGSISTNSNQAPSFGNILPDTTIAEMEALAYLYTGTDPNDDALTFSLVSGPDGSSIDATGNFSWTPTFDQAGVYDIITSLTDGIETVNDTSIVTVAATNRAPSFTNTLPDTTILEMKTLTYLYTAEDLDGDPLTFQLVSHPEGSTMSSDGNLSWTPVVGQTGVYEIIAEVSDGANQVTDTTTITVTTANNAPYFTASIPDTTVTEKILLNYQYMGEDLDGDALTFALQSGPDGATISGDGAFYWTPATPEDIVATIIVSLTDGITTVYDTAEVSVLTGIDDITTLPTEFSLSQNYPNPFNPSTTIYYSLPDQANVNLTIYDITGQKIQTLLNSEISAGYHEISFDASRLAGGVYLYRISAISSNGFNFLDTKKMLLLK